MSTYADTGPRPVVPTRDLALVLRAGLLTAVTDGLFSSLLSVFAYGSTVTRLFQSVASTVLGARAFDGGAATAVLGVLMHVGVALAWSAVFLALVKVFQWADRRLTTPLGVIASAAVYGPLVWTIMSFVVIPVLTQRPPSVTVRWWIQFVGHAPFVGLPIVATISRAHRRGRSGGPTSGL